MPTASSRPTESPLERTSVLSPRSNASGSRVIVLGTVAATLLTLCFFAPRFWLWPIAGLPLDELIAIQPEIHRAFHALQQLQNPWMRIDDAVNRVIEWRLLWPTIGHHLGFSNATYFAVPFVGALAALASVASITWRVTRHPLPTLSATFLAASSSWFFVSTGWLAYFDSWLILALLLAAFARSRWVMFAAALFAPWVDERFVLALPLCIAVRAVAADRESVPEPRALVREAAILLAGILPYVAARIGAELCGVRATSGSYWTGRSLLPAPAHAMIWGSWNGLRLGWILVVVAGVAAFRTGKHRVAVAVVFATLALNLCVADDISRSTSVAVPAVLAALLLAWQHRAAQARKALPLLCLGNLVLPAQHVIAAPPGAAVAFHCVPILAADAEFERRRNPPEFASSAAYTRRSMDHLQAQLFPRALAAAEIAVRLDPDYGKARANRGILLYVTGKKAEGAADLDRALQQSPELYDARIQRAAFRQEAGDLRGALEDVRQALVHMPADWPRRADALKFERALAGQMAR
jgi:hypothetical protein